MFFHSIINKGIFFFFTWIKSRTCTAWESKSWEKQMFRCGSWLTYLPRELVLVWVFGFWNRGCWLSCLLSLPRHWFYRRPGKKIWKMFSLSINEHQIILQCALVCALWQVGSQRLSQIKQRCGCGGEVVIGMEVRNCFKVLDEMMLFLNFHIF